MSSLNTCRLVIFNYLAVFSLLFLCASASKEVTLSSHPILLILSYDGFRYDYLERVETRYLHRVKSKGVSVPFMRNQFSSDTFPNHHSMATGLYIESHGIVGNGIYDQDLGYLSGYKSDPGFWNYSTGIIPLWTANELAGDGRHSGVMMWPGGNVPWGPGNTLATYSKDYKAEWKGEEVVDQVMSWITDEERPANLVMVYFDEPDNMGHGYGPKSPQVANMIQRLDNTTGYLVERLEGLGISDKVNLMLLSDHGMIEVLPTSYIPHFGFLDNVNNSVYNVTSKSPVLHILPRKESDTQRIFEAFAGQTEKYNFSVYLTRELSVKKPNWHYAAPRRTAPILAVAKPGYAFEEYWGINQVRTTGLHGYDPEEDARMYPYFMAVGPLFKENATVEPFDNVDIYPFVCHILGLRPGPNNGSLRNILPLLKEPGSAFLMLERGQVNSTSGAHSGMLVGLLVISIVITVTISGIVFFRRKTGYRDPSSLSLNEI